MDSKDKIVEEIFSLYAAFGDEDYIGEPVSQIEHMSQAAQLAMQNKFDDEVIVAAFFHDIGHICVMKNKQNDMEGYGVKSHEKIGAAFLRQKGFPENVARLVENHVQSKRYLTYKDPSYYQALSEASKTTLTFQGGIMTTEEASAFEKDPLFETSIRMRKWDELAKETNVPILDLEMLKKKVRRVLMDEN